MRKDIRDREVKEHLERIRNDFGTGFNKLAEYPKSVTMFGSSMIGPEHSMYKQSVDLSASISNSTGYAVITGGGPGLMEAFNKGAFEAGGKSVGFNIALPHDHKANAYMTDNIKFSYFFARKALMTFTAEAYVFLPGGFGTFDELFSVLTLIQTEKIPRVPVILFGSEFWNDVVTLMKNTLLDKFGTIRAKDLELFKVSDDIAEIVKIIKEAPVSEWWKNLN